MNIPQVSHGKILEDGDIPVFLVTFSTQEVLMFRNSLTGEVAVGAPNKVEQCTYAAVITRVQDELEDELTAGWKVIEVRVCLIASFFFPLRYHGGTCPVLRNLSGGSNVFHRHIFPSLHVWWLHISSRNYLG